MMDMMELEDVNTSSRWVKLLYYLWKIFTCLFLHLLLIAIVIGYCFFGMFMFQNLESQYEKDTKKNITHIRQNISNHIWNYTHSQKYLYKENWTDGVRISLKDFERQLVWSMRKGGWNGNDSEDSLLWTKDGALFYSIIVITTIGLIIHRAVTEPEICALPYKYKLFLCKEMNKTIYFGFTFAVPDPPKELPMPCSLKTVTFKHCTVEDCPPINVDMYQCPPMMYPNLETFEFNTLPVASFISGATKTQMKFLFYFQENNLSPIYPKKLAFNVMLDKYSLDNLLSSQRYAELRVEKRKRTMRLETADSDIEKRFSDAMNIRNIRKPYIKFGYTLNSTPLCGLSRLFKIHFCRLVAKNNYKGPLSVFHSGYDEFECHMRKIFFDNPERDYLKKGYWVTMLKCPAHYTGDFGEMPQFRVTTKFLSPSLTENSVFLFGRRNSWHEPIRPKAFVYDIGLDDFKEDRRRMKYFMKPHYFPPEPDSRESMSYISSRMSQLSFGFPSLVIIFSRDVVEDEVILLANEIKETKPYERFRRTFFKPIVSSWSRDDVQYVCRQILLHSSYNMKMSQHVHEPETKCCTSQLISVKLAMRDAEWLPRRTMRASRCPPVLGYAFQYFIAGGLGKNTVVVYARYNFYYFAFPDSLVLRLDEIYDENYYEL